LGALDQCGDFTGTGHVGGNGEGFHAFTAQSCSSFFEALSIACALHYARAHPAQSPRNRQADATPGAGNQRYLASEGFLRIQGSFSQARLIKPRATFQRDAPSYHQRPQVVRGSAERNRRALRQILEPGGESSLRQRSGFPIIPEFCDWQRHWRTRLFARLALVLEQ
jgi:hypothetical protein